MLILIFSLYVMRKIRFLCLFLVILAGCSVRKEIPPMTPMPPMTPVLPKTSMSSSSLSESEISQKEIVEQKPIPSFENYLFSFFPGTPSSICNEQEDCDLPFVGITQKEIDLQQNFLDFAGESHFILWWDNYSPRFKFFAGTGRVTGKLSKQVHPEHYYFCFEEREECYLRFQKVWNLDFEVVDTNLPFLSKGDVVPMGCLDGETQKFLYVWNQVDLKQRTSQYLTGAFGAEFAKELVAHLEEGKEISFEIAIKPNAEYAMREDLICPNPYLYAIKKL